MSRISRVRPTLWHQLAIALLCCGLIFLLLASLADFWHMDPPASRLWAYSLGAVAFGWLWCRFPGVGWLLVLLIPFLLWAGSGSEHGRLLLEPLLVDLWDFWGNVQVAGWEAQFSPLLGEAFLLLTGCALAPLFLQESLGRGTAFQATALGTVIFGIQWSWFFDESLAYFVPYLLLALLLWAVGQVAHRRAQWRALQRRVLNRPGIGGAVAAISLTALLASLLPADLPAMNLGALGERAQELFPVLTRLRGGTITLGDRFTLATTGFNPSPGALGGPVQLDHTLALVLVVPEPPQQTIYLRGTTFRIYNGRTWFPGEADLVAVPPGGILPTHFAEDVPVETRTFEIRPALRFGRTLFGVWEPVRVEGLEYLADSDGNLLATQDNPPESPYTVTARVPIYSGDQIRSREPSAPDKAFQPYLQLPTSVPDRVRDLAHLITSGQPHPYDKAVALETWLRQMPYDLNVPAPPAGRDFVDYFLFDLRRGYCTYFSTAMVIMLRELGIPARLVQGFAVPAHLGDARQVDGGLALPVTNAMAHAWVEAYFPSYGWVTFDPTPRGDLPLPDRNAPDPSPEEPDANETPSSEPEAEDSPRPAPPRMREEGDTTLPADGAASGTAGRLPPVLLSLPLLLLLTIAGLRLRRQRRAATADAALTVQQIWVKTEQLLARFGAGRRPHQTHREYARSLAQRWPGLGRSAIQMAQDYERARYAPPDQEPEPAAAHRAWNFWHRIHRLLRVQYGWWRYLWRQLGLPWPRLRRKA